ncbi:peptidase, partial [Klebsiella pneumoniae]|nr:peptidase [Klebsiella pneumoniae]
HFTGLKACLRAGYPFVFGFAVYDSFMSNEVAQTGKMPMPDMRERMQGGHAVRCVCYDDTMGDGHFIVANSWGTRWG